MQHLLDNQAHEAASQNCTIKGDECNQTGNLRLGAHVYLD